MGLPLPRGIIHIYNHNIQRSSSLKQLDQSKINFKGSICMNGDTNVIIDKLGHMTKMATMSIYGKNPSNQRAIGPENAHLKPDLGVLSHNEMTLNTHTPLLTS